MRSFMLILMVFAYSSLFAKECAQDVIPNRFVFAINDQENAQIYSPGNAFGATFPSTAFDGYPDPIRVFSQMLDSCKKKGATAATCVASTDKIRDAFADSVIRSSYRKGVRIFSVWAHWPNPAFGAQCYLRALERFNKNITKRADKYFVRLVFSPNADVMEANLRQNQDTSISNMLDRQLKALNKFDSKAITYSAVTERSLLNLAKDPFYGGQYLDGRLVNLTTNTISSINSYVQAGMQARMLRARVGVVPKNFADQYYSDMTADLSSRQVNLVLLGILGAAIDGVRNVSPSSPIYDVNLAFRSIDGESSIITAYTKIENGRAKTGRVLDKSDLVSFGDCLYSDSTNKSFPARYRFYACREKTWKEFVYRASRMIKSKDTSTYVSMYAHPNLRICDMATMDHYRFYKGAGVSLIHNSWMPPYPPENDAEHIQAQMSYTSSISDQIGAIWKEDYTWPTCAWEYTKSNWSWPQIGQSTLARDFNGDGVVESISGISIWDTAFFRKTGYPSGQNNLKMFLAHSAAMKKLGGCGMTYANWPSHWMTDGRESLGAGWDSVVGPKNSQSLAFDRINKMTTLPKSNAAIYVNGAARLLCEERGGCGPKYFADVAYKAMKLNGWKRVDFIGDELIFSDSVKFSSYTKIYMVPAISSPAGDALVAWKGDPRYQLVSLRLSAKKGQLDTLQISPNRLGRNWSDE